MPTKEQNEFCAECGNFVVRLDRTTGWCITCTTLLNHNTRTAVEEFLYAHADHIEHYVLQGKSLNQAIDLLRSEIARFRVCACCGALIKRGGPNSVFCRKNEKCRQTSRKYVYLYDRKGLTKAEALSQVLEAINGND